MSRVPPPGLECMATMEDITEESKTYCEYRTEPSGKWHPSLFSCDIVQTLVETQFQKYIDAAEKADCAAALRRAITQGPPIYVSDKTAMPLPEGDTHISTLWYASDDKERSAKLVGALEGEEREKFWSTQKECLAAMEAAEAGKGGEGGESGESGGAPAAPAADEAV